MRRIGWTAPTVMLLFAGIGAPAAAQEPIFLDGFEIGSVCAWSSALPPVTCAPYQTCAEAAPDYWACFEMPFLAPPEPAAAEGPTGELRIGRADLYLLIDRSGSMFEERQDLRDSLPAVVDAVRCPPQGSGTPPNCYTDLWVGAGTIGYMGSGLDVYRNAADLQVGTDFAPAINVSEPGGCCAEASTLSVALTLTGAASTSFGCGANAVPARATCVGSPADLAGFTPFGYPCFRQEAIPLVVLPSDEPLTDGDCPLPTTVVPLANAVRARILGIVGSGPTGSTEADLQMLAVSTGAIDGNNGNAPLVFDGPGTSASEALQTALLTAQAGLPLREVTAAVVDDPNDGVDVGDFVDHVEALDGGHPTCLTGLQREDRDLDGFPETFVAVPAGGVVCFALVPVPNATVPGAAAAQNFGADFRVTAEAVLLVDLPLLFLVPPG